MPRPRQSTKTTTRLTFKKVNTKTHDADLCDEYSRRMLETFFREFGLFVLRFEKKFQNLRTHSGARLKPVDASLLPRIRNYDANLEVTAEFHGNTFHGFGNNFCADGIMGFCGKNKPVNHLLRMMKTMVSDINITMCSQSGKHYAVWNSDVKMPHKVVNLFTRKEGVSMLKDPISMTKTGHFRDVDMTTNDLPVID